MLDNYKLIEKVGQGGFGEVHKAYDQMGRIVAVKILHSLGEENTRRFHSEMKILAGMNHPHIVRVFDGKVGTDKSYLVMEYVDAQSLHALLKKNGPFPPKKAVRILKQVIDAVDYAHQQGIIHRDVKPHNILYDRKNDHCYLTDFGIAKKIDGKKDITNTGEIIGTLGYLSPEQIDQEGVDERSDIFSLGMSLYTMLVGREVFHNFDSYRKVLEIKSKRRIPLLSSSGKRFSSSLEGIFSQATRKNKGERYATVRELGKDLDRFIRGEAPLGKVKAYTLHEYVAMNRWAIFIAGMIICLVLIGIPVTISKNQAIEKEVNLLNVYIKEINKAKFSIEQENKELEQTILLEKAAQRLKLRVLPTNVKTLDEINTYFTDRFRDIPSNYRVNLMWAKALSLNLASSKSKRDFLKYQKAIVQQIKLSRSKQEDISSLVDAYEMVFSSMIFGMQWEKRLKILQRMVALNKDYLPLYDLANAAYKTTEINYKETKEKYDNVAVMVEKQFSKDTIINNEVLGLYYSSTYDFTRASKYFYRAEAISPISNHIKFLLGYAYITGAQRKSVAIVNRKLYYSIALENFEKGLKNDMFYTQGYLDYMKYAKAYLSMLTNTQQSQSLFVQAKIVHNRAKKFLPQNEIDQLNQAYLELIR